MNGKNFTKQEVENVLGLVAYKASALVIDWATDSESVALVEMNGEARLAISKNENGAEAAILVPFTDVSGEDMTMMFPLSAFLNLNVDQLVVRMKNLQTILDGCGLGV